MVMTGKDGRRGAKDGGFHITPFQPILCLALFRIDRPKGVLPPLKHKHAHVPRILGLAILARGVEWCFESLAVCPPRRGPDVG